MATRKLQLYLSEEEYLFLRHLAGERGSMAAAVRQLIDSASRPSDYASDPFYQHLMGKKEGSGRSYHAEGAKRDLYKQPR